MKRYFVIFLILGIFAGITFLPRNFGQKEQIVFRVEKGQGIGGISANLEKEKLAWWSQIFKVYAFLTGKADNLQAGCYFLSNSMNTPKIAGILSSGKIAKKMITIPEGFTSAQIAERLQNVTRSDRVTLGDYEGYLFPDTYEIPYCAELEKIVEMMTGNFNKKTAGLKITPEIVVMSSLLEKELITKEDKEIASGILWKRLKVGMPLQVDAHMWTYENYGLPKNPIANPGLESILTALKPKESPYFYYLSAPDGKTIFSRTLEEHNIAKAKYLTGK